MFFVDASTDETITAGLKDIVSAIGKGDSEGDALDLLSMQRNEWLLFFDNADDPNLNLRTYFPKCSHGNILITSRNRHARHHALSPESNCKVSDLMADEAKDLLLKFACLEGTFTDETKSLAMTIVQVCHSTFLVLSM